MSYNKDRIAMIDDATCDILEGLNQLTDREMPSTEAIYNLSASVEKLIKAKARQIELSGHDTASHHEEWGNADPTAKELFEKLEKHYMGFWRCAAEYTATHSDEAKESMLMHLEHQLHAHDAIAGFVMGNCTVLCDETKEVVMKWKESKKGQAHGAS